MITAPMAMNQVMMPKIAPIVPYVLLSEMIVSEKSCVSEFRAEGTGCRSPLKMSSGPPSCHHPRSFVQLLVIRGVVLRV